MTNVNKALPHQIVLMTTPRSGREALDGSVTAPMGIAVTCNCHRIGQSDHFNEVIAALPVGDAVPHAWRMWNHRSLHKDQETFRPNEKMVEKYGILA